MSSLAGSLRPLVESGLVPGLVAAAGRGDDIEVVAIGEAAVGGAPMTTDSWFRIASVTKPITAVVALTLVSDGTLALDDPIDDLLPELRDPRVVRSPDGPVDDTVPAVRPITVRHLLTSTNGHGFPSDFDAPVAGLLVERLAQGPPRPQQVPPPDRWMATLGGIPLLHQPGEGFTYNTAFDVLGVVCARATGSALPELMRARVFDPLGMDDTGFAFPTGPEHRRTALYERADDGFVELDGIDGEWCDVPPFPSGAGGLVSSLADLLAFERMLLAGGGDVLPPEYVATMTSGHLTPDVRATDTVFLDGQSWGFGGGVDIVVRHPWNVPGRFGWVGGTGTSAYVVPDDGSVAILLTQVQLDGPSGSRVIEGFWAAAARHLGHGPG